MTPKQAASEALIGGRARPFLRPPPSRPWRASRILRHVHDTGTYVVLPRASLDSLPPQENTGFPTLWGLPALRPSDKPVKNQNKTRFRIQTPVPCPAVSAVVPALPHCRVLVGAQLAHRAESRQQQPHSFPVCFAARFTCDLHPES